MMYTQNAFVLTVALLALANCGGSSGTSASLADNPASAKFVAVTNGVADITLSQESNGSVANSVGTAAYVLGLDTDRGQAVTASGYTVTGGGW